MKKNKAYIVTDDNYAQEKTIEQLNEELNDTTKKADILRYSSIAFLILCICGHIIGSFTSPIISLIATICFAAIIPPAIALINLDSKIDDIQKQITEVKDNSEQRENITEMLEIPSLEPNIPSNESIIKESKIVNKKRNR